jgi:hypothetical protein
MIAIISQAHNLNKFPFLLNAVKDRLQQRLPRDFLFFFPSELPNRYSSHTWPKQAIKWSAAPLSAADDQLAHLCSCLLMRASCCALQLSLVGSMGVTARIQAAGKSLGNINYYKEKLGSILWCWVLLICVHQLWIRNAQSKIPCTTENPETFCFSGAILVKFQSCYILIKSQLRCLE